MLRMNTLKAEGQEQIAVENYYRKAEFQLRLLEYAERLMKQKSLRVQHKKVA